MVTLTPEWRIEADQHNVILVRCVPGRTKEGEPQLVERRSFHPTLEKAIAHLFHEQTRELIVGGEYTLVEFARALRRMAHDLQTEVRAKKMEKPTNADTRS